MNHKPIPPRILAILVASSAVFTIATVVLLVAAHLFGKMGDAAGQTILDHIALGVGILWVIDLLCLLFALGINSIGNDS